MGVLAAWAVLASEMPLMFSIPFAAAAAVQGARTARREVARPPRELVASGTGHATFDGVAITDLALHWRGPLAFLRYRDANGCVRRLSWWPDTLPPESRRELRLAVPVQAAASSARSMAP